MIAGVRLILHAVIGHFTEEGSEMITSGFLCCSVWVMMNKLTRKLSKIPEEVRGEIEPYFLNSAPVVDEDGRKLPKLDESIADRILSGLAVSGHMWNMSISRI